MSYSASVLADLESRDGEWNGKDHSVVDRKPVERKHALLNPMEELSQLVEEGQGRRRSWIKPHHQEAEDQGSQEALFEGHGEEVAHYRIPKPAKQHH